MTFIPLPLARRVAIWDPAKPPAAAPTSAAFCPGTCRGLRATTLKLSLLALPHINPLLAQLISLTILL